MDEEFIITSPACTCLGKKLKKDLIELIMKEGAAVKISGKEWKPEQGDITITRKKYLPKTNQTTYSYCLRMRNVRAPEVVVPKDALPDNILSEGLTPPIVKKPIVDEKPKPVGIKIKGGRIIRT
ncbi:MAG: hypothetical protein ACYC3F_16720 [Gemmatimonadaceae bacterium]